MCTYEFVWLQQLNWLLLKWSRATKKCHMLRLNWKIALNGIVAQFVVKSLFHSPFLFWICSRIDPVSDKIVLFNVWWVYTHTQKKRTRNCSIYAHSSNNSIGTLHTANVQCEVIQCTVWTFIYRNNSLTRRYSADKLFKHLWCNEYPHIHIHARTLTHTHMHMAFNRTMNSDAEINNAIVFLLHANLCWRIAQLFRIFTISVYTVYSLSTFNSGHYHTFTFAASVGQQFYSWILYAIERITSGCIFRILVATFKQRIYICTCDI